MGNGNKNNKLIKIDGVPLYGLLNARRDRRMQEAVDMDYVGALVTQMASKDPRKSAEAKHALQYLNLFCLGLYDGRVKEFEDAYGEAPEFRKAVNASRGAAQRDVLNCNRNSTISLHQAIEAEFLDFSEITNLSKKEKALKKAGKK